MRLSELRVGQIWRAFEVKDDAHDREILEIHRDSVSYICKNGIEACIKEGTIGFNMMFDTLIGIKNEKR